MFLSLKKSKLMLRRQAGFSVALADETVKGLPKQVDGKRLKIKLADVERVVSEANKPTVLPKTDTTRKIRPFRKELRQQI